MPNVFFSNTTPAASAGSTLIAFASSGSNVSASMLTACVAANNLSDVNNAATAFNNLSPLTTLGDTLYGGASGFDTRLAGNITTSKLFQTQTGSGSVSAAPVWAAIVAADVPTLNQSTTGTALNVTGTVAIANGGTGATTAAAALTALGGASLTAANAFSGVQTYGTAATVNLNSSSIVLGGGLITGTATMGGNLNIVNGQFISGSGSFFFTTSNAASWQEFRMLDSTGGTAPADALTFQYNTRSTSGGTDNWLPAITVSAQTGVASFANSVAIAGGTARQQLSVGSGLDLYTNANPQSPTVPSIRGGVAALVINCMPTGAIFFNYDTGTGCPVNFCNGAGGTVATISSAGVAAFASVSAGAASFAGVASSAAITGTLGGWETWTPACTGGGSMSAGAPSAVTAYYLLIGPICFFRCRFTTALSGTMNLTLNVTGAPVAEKLGSPVICRCMVGTAVYNCYITSSTITVTPASGTGTFTTGSNTITISGEYQWA